VSKTAEIIVDKIVDDLSDRRGIGQEWDQIETDIKNEIKETWCNIVDKVLGIICFKGEQPSE